MPLKKSSHYEFFGSIPAIVTPFKKNGDLDLPAFRKIIDYQLAGGVDGIVVAGSTGEGATLSEEEFVTLLKAVIHRVAGKVPVIAGAGSNDTKKAVRLSKLAGAAGADGLLHVTPYYNKPTEEGLLAHFKAIGEATDLPVILYNVPGRTGSNVLPRVIVRIAREAKTVVAVKEASGSVGQMAEIISETAKNGPKNFAVLSGDDALSLPLIALGGQGCISVVCNEAPGLFSDLIHFALDGNMQEARRLHYVLLPLMNLNFIESNPIPLKAALAKMGLIEENLRLPLCPLSEKNRFSLHQALQELKLI